MNNFVLFQLNNTRVTFSAVLMFAMNNEFAAELSSRCVCVCVCARAYRVMFKGKPHSNNKKTEEPPHALGHNIKKKDVFYCFFCRSQKILIISYFGFFVFFTCMHLCIYARGHIKKNIRMQGFFFLIVVFEFGS